MPGRPKNAPETCSFETGKKDREMPKLKSKSSAKKRFRLTASGKVRMNFACKRHNMRKRPTKMLRKARGTKIAAAPDARIIKRNFLPYA